MLTPFPAISSKANHRACMTNTKSTIKKVAKKGIKNDFNKYLSKIFMILNRITAILINHII